MKEKYQKFFVFQYAKLSRHLLRSKIKNLVSWSPVEANTLEEGCTAIIGLCSKLPNVLPANLTCLSQNKWTEFKKVLIAVDGEKSALPDGFEQEVTQKFADLNVSFFYYNKEQVKAAEQKLHFTHVYCWLSWCICLSQVTTKTAFIHDYDALLIGNSLKDNYDHFIQSGAKVQGIKWYKINGFEEQDRLASTFECLIDVAWIRSFDPILLFSRVGKFKNHSVDYDILIDLQANYLAEQKRDIMPMSLNMLVHPSQMIKQYTIFRKFPQKSIPCFSAIMIPFFYFLSGDNLALIKATQAIIQGNRQSINLLSDGVLMNLSQLTTKQVDWILKQMLEVLVALKIPPRKDFLNYGTELYKISLTPPEEIWKGDFAPIHKQWLTLAIQLA